MQTRGQQLVEFLLAVALLFPLVFGALKLAHIVQRSLCPAGTYLTGSLQNLAEEASLVGTSLALYFLIRNRLVWHTPIFRRVFSLHRSISDRRKSTRRIVQIVLSVLAVLLVISSILFATSEFCLVPERIFVRQWPWTKVRQYRWTDVRLVWTSCSFVRVFGGRFIHSYWDASFFLVMSDGTALNIISAEPYISRAFPNLAHSLNGASFEFNATHVSTDCGHRDANLLRRRP